MTRPTRRVGREHRPDAGRHQRERQVRAAYSVGKRRDRGPPSPLPLRGGRRRARSGRRCRGGAGSHRGRSSRHRHAGAYDGRARRQRLDALGQGRARARRGTRCRRAPEKSGAKSGEPRLGLVVEARHQDRALGDDLAARERRPEQVRREHQRAVLVAAVEQVMEEVGHAKVVVHPTLLLGDRQRLSGEDRARGTSPVRCAACRRPAWNRRTVSTPSTDTPSGNSLTQVKWSRAQVVRISTVQPRSASPWAVSAQNGLGASHDTWPVAGRHEADATGALHGGAG